MIRFGEVQQGEGIMEQTNRCGLLDMNERKWIEIEPLKYEKLRKEFFKCCINKYDNNVLYIVSTTGNTQRFDFDKNKWVQLIEAFEMKFQLDSLSDMVWMEDEYTLCCGNGHSFVSLDIDEIPSGYEFIQSKATEAVPNLVSKWMLE